MGRGEPASLELTDAFAGQRRRCDVELAAQGEMWHSSSSISSISSGVSSCIRRRLNPPSTAEKPVDRRRQVAARTHS